MDGMRIPKYLSSLALKICIYTTEILLIQMQVGSFGKQLSISTLGLMGATVQANIFFQNQIL